MDLDQMVDLVMLAQKVGSSHETDISWLYKLKEIRIGDLDAILKRYAEIIDQVTMKEDMGWLVLRYPLLMVGNLYTKN